MKPRKPRIPSYRLHKASNQAVVVLNGRSFYLGVFGTAESKAEYQRIIAEWLANQRRPLPAANVGSVGPTSFTSSPATHDLTVTELCVANWQHAKQDYVKDGEPTSDKDTIRQALRFLRPLHSHTPAREFGPLALKAVRDAMVRHPITRKVKVRDGETCQVREEVKVRRVGLARRHINKQVGRTKRLFKWAAENELLPVTVFQALATVAGLRKDRSTAREKEPVKRVVDEHDDAVLPHLPHVIRNMTQVQKPCDIDRTGDVWEYRPGRHKTEHRDRELVVFLGPKASEGQK